MADNHYSNHHHQHGGRTRDRVPTLDLNSISSTDAPPAVPGSQTTNLVQLGQYIKEDEGVFTKAMEPRGYDHRAWFREYERVGYPRDLYLAYEVLDWNKYTTVDCITKSVLLYEKLFGKAPCTEETMRCYDGSPILFEEVKPIRTRIEEWVETHIEDMMRATSKLSINATIMVNTTTILDNDEADAAAGPTRVETPEEVPQEYRNIAARARRRPREPAEGTAHPRDAERCDDADTAAGLSTPEVRTVAQERRLEEERTGRIEEARANARTTRTRRRLLSSRLFPSLEDCDESLSSSGGLSSSSDHHYAVSRTVTKSTFNSLIDRGANGGLAGEDMRLIEYDDDRTIDVQGIDNHEIPQLRLGTFGAVAKSTQGEVLLIFCQYAHIQRGKSIHSALQLEDNNVTVDDRPIRLNGGQRLITAEGFTLPLDFKRGLAYLRLRRYKDEEYINLPHVYMTRDVPWFPAQYDSEPDDSAIGRKGNAIDTLSGYDDSGELLEASAARAMRSGNYRRHTESFVPLVPAVLSHLQRHGPALIAHIHHQRGDDSRILSYGELSEGSVDYDARRQYFLNVPSDVVRRTYDATTRHYRNISAPTNIKQR